MLTYKEIREFIERNDSIVIFRHIHGDYDAYGAQLGLKELIKNNYPEKEVYSMKQMYDDGVQPSAIAEKYGLSPAMVCRIINC